ncbi:MAG: transposase [Alphaproteobacteria bacterium]|nr:transposase [Alphaproteobacteria bacterium]
MPKLPTVNVNEISSFDEAKQVISTLLDTVDLQQKEILALKEEIARLKKYPRKPQFNKQSHHVSAKDMEKDSKPWQKGTRGKIVVDHHIQLPELKQCACGSTEFKTITTTTKIVQGVSITRNNTAYHGRRKQCISCGKTYNTPIPDDVKGISFDRTTQSLVSFLKFHCRFTQPLLYRFFHEFGISISYGELQYMLQKNSQKLQEAYLYLRKQGLYKSTYLHADATGAKRRQRATSQIEQQFLHIAGNMQFSLFKITKKYNSSIMAALLGKHGRKKIYLSDDASPNGKRLRIIRKQLCLIHEVRHYRSLSPRYKIQRKKQQEVVQQWQQFYQLAKEYRHDPVQEKKDTIRNLFDTITRQTTGYEPLDRQLALTRMKRKKLLLFLAYPIVPIQNNQAERDLREFVILRKISGETKSQAGDRSIERHLSVIQTVKKQGLPIFATLHGLLTHTLPLSVLTANIS